MAVQTTTVEQEIEQIVVSIKGIQELQKGGINREKLFAIAVLIENIKRYLAPSGDAFVEAEWACFDKNGETPEDVGKYLHEVVLAETRLGLDIISEDAFAEICRDQAAWVANVIAQNIADAVFWQQYSPVLVKGV